MKRSNLIELFRTLSSSEIKELGEFVKSPYFNKNEKDITLYNVLKKFYPAFDSVSLKKEKIFAKIYSGEKFKDSTLRLLIFYLYECAKKYLQVKSNQRDSLTSNINLIRDLIERGLLKEAEKAINENTKALESCIHKDEEYFWNKYLNDDVRLVHQERLYAGRYEKYMTGSILDELPKSLTDNYLLRLLKLYTVVLNANALFKTKLNVNYYKNILDSFDRNYFKDRPILLVYYYAARMLEFPEDENNYYEFKKLVLTHEDKFDIEALLDLYINLENYCVRRGRIGRGKFDKELFEIYKIEIGKKLYLEDGSMGSYFYKSAATTALMIHETEWAEKFIEEYRDKLLQGFRDPAYYHCYARIAIYRKDYNKALEYLSKIKTDEVYLKAESRLLFAVVYYELGIEDSLYYLLDTMRHFFKNDKYMADDRNDFYAFFVRFLNKLSSIKHKDSLDDLEEFKHKVNSTERLFYKNWLLEKIEELEK